MASVLVVVLAMCLFPIVCNATVAAFNHGVASGDPLPHAIIVWTRVTPRTSVAQLNVRWVVSNKPTWLPTDTSNVVSSGVFTTDASRDWTVKVDVTNLPPGVQLWYRFEVHGFLNGAASEGSVLSPTGTFRLPGDDIDHLKYAVFSCSNWGYGYFNAYDAASQLDLDFWIHLGDWIYEYGTNTYPSPTEAVRYQPAPLGLQPAADAGGGDEKLAEYRKRYSLYRQDPALQALSARAPLIAIWDDHEFANDAWMDGAENHNSTTEGDWGARKVAAYTTYFEWMPIRDMVNGNSIGPYINRTFHFGKLASFIMMEGRITGRTAPVKIDPLLLAASQAAFSNPDALTAAQIAQLQAYRAYIDGLRNNPDAHIIGAAQTAWLTAETVASANAGIKWQMYGSQTVMFDNKFDLDAAIAKEKLADPARAALWQQALDNVTFTGPQFGAGFLGSFQSYDTTCFARSIMGVPSTTTPAILGAARAALAASRYGYVYSFDAWQGHLAERRAVLSAIRDHANNAVVYGGDSHNDFAGVNRLDNVTIGAQFCGSAVTSPGFENYFGILPLDFIASSLVEGTRADGMRYANTESKGFMYVELDQFRQKLSYVKTDQCSVDYKPKMAACFAYYSAAGRALYGKTDELHAIPCHRNRVFGTGPWQPYRYALQLNNGFGRTATTNAKKL